MQFTAERLRERETKRCPFQTRADNTQATTDTPELFLACCFISAFYEYSSLKIISNQPPDKQESLLSISDKTATFNQHQRHFKPRNTNLRRLLQKIMAKTAFYYDFFAWGDQKRLKNL
ncbi:hypothetical protein [Oceanobacter antarcticus]|uniref:Uncharacterized protein n=1 Tax=Oceanobacter antarcticus TaxID=3133425 RepID=A0ABW8NP30_9GAMM